MAPLLPRRACSYACAHGSCRSGRAPTELLFLRRGGWGAESNCKRSHGWLCHARVHNCGPLTGGQSGVGSAAAAVHASCGSNCSTCHVSRPLHRTTRPSRSVPPQQRGHRGSPDQARRSGPRGARGGPTAATAAWGLTASVLPVGHPQGLERLRTVGRELLVRCVLGNGWRPAPGKHPALRGRAHAACTAAPRKPGARPCPPPRAPAAAWSIRRSWQTAGACCNPNCRP